MDYSRQLLGEDGVWARVCVGGPTVDPTTLPMSMSIMASKSVIAKRGKRKRWSQKLLVQDGWTATSS